MHLSLDTHFNPSPIYHLYVLFLAISYQARFCLQISHLAILFTMLQGFLNCGSFIVHVLLMGTCKAFTWSVFLPGTYVRMSFFQAPDYMFIDFKSQTKLKDWKRILTMLFHDGGLPMVLLLHRAGFWSDGDSWSYHKWQILDIRLAWFVTGYLEEPQINQLCLRWKIQIYLLENLRRQAAHKKANSGSMAWSPPQEIGQLSNKKYCRKVQLLPR